MYVAKRTDGTFETLVNDFPYHVTADDPLFAELSARYGDLQPGFADIDGVSAEDHRNTYGWLNDEVFIMTGFGPLPDGFTRVPPLNVMIEIFNDRVTGWLDAFARTRTYMDVANAVTYLDDEDEHFAAEASYIKRLRSRTWRWCNSYLNEVVSGQRPVPQLESFMVELADAMKPEWPVPDTRAGILAGI